jgi:hypothetical protein
MTTATAPTPTDSAPASEPSASVAADAPTPEPTPVADAGTLLTKQEVTPEDSAKPADLKLALPSDSPLNPDVLPRITDLARKAGVTDAAAAQAFVDLLNGEVAATMDTMRANLAKGGSAWTAVVTEMEKQALADPALGNNDPAKLTQAVVEAKQVVDKYAPEGFADYLDESGLGSDPRFLKFARKVYEGMREDKLVNGAPPPPKPKTAAQRMYPNMPSRDG